MGLVDPLPDDLTIVAGDDTTLLAQVQRSEVAGSGEGPLFGVDASSMI
jgi:hypothetical protein